MATNGGSGTGPAGTGPAGTKGLGAGGAGGAVTTTEDPALPQVTNLEAKTWCGGEQIDLSWDPPAGVVVVEYRLKRARTTFALFVDDDTELLSAWTTGTTTYVDVNLLPSTVYYYTVFYSTDGAEFIVADAARVAGVSIEDFKASEGEYWLYDSLPGEVKRQDAAVGPDQYTQRRYFDVLQCGIQLYRGYLDVYRLLPDYDLTPAGRIREPANQYAIIEKRLSDLGFPAQRALGIDTMRRVALGIMGVRQWKGSCTGLVMFIKLLTTWDSQCQSVSDGGGCGGGTLFQTWDGVSARKNSQGGAADIDNTAGQLTDNTGAIFSAGLYADGVLVDALGNIVCIEDNTQTSFTLQDPAGQLQFERGFNQTLGLAEDPSGRLIHDHSLRGMEIKILSGATTTIYDNYRGGGLGVIDNTTVIELSSVPGSYPPVGPFSVAASFLNEPQTFANREPEMRYTAHWGEHYRLFKPQFDDSLRGVFNDPFDYLFGSSSTGSGATLGFVPGPLDVIMWINAGVAGGIGFSDGLVDEQLDDSTATFTINGLTGNYLNPNRNQTQLFKIIGNSATQIFVEAGSLMTTVGIAGSSYYVVDPLSARRVEALASTAHLFLPTQSRAFFYFL